MKPILILPLVILLGAITTGCRTAVNTVENAEKSAIITPIKDTRIIGDRSLEDRIGIVRMHTAMAPTGIMRMQAEITNFTNSIQDINYQIEWYDANGMVISQAGNGWQQLQFMARESRSLAFTAPSPLAKDFRIKLLEPVNE